MTGTNKRYMALEKCANTGPVLVLEHLNVEDGKNFKTNDKSAGAHVYDSVEDAINDETVLLHKVKTKSFLRGLKSIMGRKSKSVHDLNENNVKGGVHSTARSPSSTKSLFDNKRIKILVETNQECHKTSKTLDNLKSSSESYSSVSMETDLDKESSFTSSTWVNFDDEQIDPFSPSMKIHKRHDSNGTKSTTPSFDGTILNMIASCLDNAEYITNCNLINMTKCNSEDSLTKSYHSNDVDDEDENDDDSDNTDSLNSF
jgi:hypothetical protein